MEKLLLITQTHIKKKWKNAPCFIFFFSPQIVFLPHNSRHLTFQAICTQSYHTTITFRGCQLSKQRAVPEKLSSLFLRKNSKKTHLILYTETADKHKKKHKHSPSCFYKFKLPSELFISHLVLLKPCYPPCGFDEPYVEN